MQDLLVCGLALLLSATSALSVARQARPGPACRPEGPLVRLEGVSEASGVAASRRTPGVLWVHNDSGRPEIVALDLNGAIKGRIRVSGAKVDDWEDLAVGPCPAGSCLYIADIGDNDGARRSVVVYRVVEPAADAAETAPVEAFHASYPDVPHDAESLFVTRDGGVFLITKGDPGPVALYRYPLEKDKTATLVPVGSPLATRVDARDRPTAADVSPDGRWLAIRTTEWLAFHRTADAIAGKWRDVARVSLRDLKEPRGEGLTFAADRTIVLVGEAGGPRRGPGTFARLECAGLPE